MPWLASGAGGADTDVMPLLERESSLTSLAGYAEEARRGEGRLVLVGGEAGGGKSALGEGLAGGLPGPAGWGAAGVAACRGCPAGAVRRAAGPGQRTGDAGRGGRGGHPLGRRGHCGAAGF